MKGFLKDIILPFLPSLLTIVGWWIVANRDSDAKKNANHNRRVEVAIKLIDKILLDAKNFYSLSGSDKEAQSIAFLLTSDFKKLSMIITLISKNCGPKEKQALGKAFIEFKKIVTGGDFETKSRAAIPKSNQIYFDIDGLYNELYIELEKIILI